MKKKALLVALLAFGAISCAREVKNVEVAVPEKVAVAVPEEEVVTFEKEKNGEEVIVKSSDKFETANMSIGLKAQRYELNRVVSGSGIKLESEDQKNAIHFNDREGILTENGEEFTIKKKK